MGTAALLKRPRTPPGSIPTVDYQTADSEHLMKRARAGVQPDEVKTVSAIIGLMVYFHVFLNSAVQMFIIFLCGKPSAHEFHKLL
jgi:hypothetical protein